MMRSRAVMPGEEKFYILSLWHVAEHEWPAGQVIESEMSQEASAPSPERIIPGNPNFPPIFEKEFCGASTLRMKQRKVFAPYNRTIL